MLRLFNPNQNGSSEEASASSSKPIEYVIFYVNVCSDGLGDIGHLVDIANPIIFAAKFPQNERVNYKPIYLVTIADARESRVNFVIESLKEGGIVKIEGIKEKFDAEYQKTHQAEVEAEIAFVKKTGEFSDSLRSPFPWAAYFNQVIAANPNVYITGKGEFLRHYEYYVWEKEFEDKLEKTAAVYFISNGAKKELKKVFKSRNIAFCRIEEHGIPQLVQIDLMNTYYRMGFNAPSPGILLKPQPKLSVAEKAKVLLSMSNKDFLGSLFDKPAETISEDDALTFVKKTLFIPFYTQRFNQSVYLYFHLMVLANISKCYDQIVFYTNGINDFNLSLLQSHGFREIRTYSGNYPWLPKKIDANHSRIIKVISGAVDYFNEADLKKYYALCDVFGACSGDKSLEKTLSFQLIPFYEQRLDFNKNIIESLIALAKAHLKDPATIIVFLETILKNRQVMISDDDMLNLAEKMDENFIADWEIIIKVIHKDYNLFDKLEAIFAEGIMPQQFYYRYRDELIRMREIGDYQGINTILQTVPVSSATLRQNIFWFYRTGHSLLAAYIYHYIISQETTESLHAYRRLPTELVTKQEEEEGYSYADIPYDLTIKLKSLIKSRRFGKIEMNPVVQPAASTITSTHYANAASLTLFSPISANDVSLRQAESLTEDKSTQPQSCCGMQ